MQGSAPEPSAPGQRQDEQPAPRQPRDPAGLPAARERPPDRTPRAEERRVRPRRDARRPKHGPKQGARSAATASAVADPSVPRASDGGAGFGSASLPAGVRSLSKAFTRAIPAAAHAVKGWARRPLGPGGRAVVTLSVDGDGRITETRFDVPPSEELQRLVRRTVLMLGTGRFALARGEVRAGSETLEIAVTLSERAPADEDSASDDAVALGFDAPGPTSPGRAWFTLASGRHFEASVRVVRSGDVPGATGR
jgi:hypothetical protein